MIYRIALLLSTVFALSPMSALAHEPPPSENNLIELAVHQFFELVPGWAFALGLVAAVAVVVALYFAWRRWRFIDFVDRVE